MDELLALLDADDGDDESSVVHEEESNAPAEEAIPRAEKTINSLSDAMDELLGTMDPVEHKPDSSKAQKHKREEEPKSVSPADQGVDDRLGIRMINRIVASVDLVDIMSSHPYHSPAVVSIMSLKELKSLLVEPPTIVDAATVQGKTRFCTVGLVFSNSGTRISSNGNAFCILTIGNFASGPCLSIFLFGHAYSTYCRSCTPGKVVAITCPKLLPPKQEGSKSKDSTTVTLSVHDLRQFQIVATARDYGLCQATNVRVRQPNGTWSNNGSCRNYVNKRECSFCEKHSKSNKGTIVAASASNAMTSGRSQTSRPKQSNIFDERRQARQGRVGGAGTTNRFLNPQGASLPQKTKVSVQPSAKRGRFQIEPRKAPTRGIAADSHRVGHDKSQNGPPKSSASGHGGHSKKPESQKQSPCRRATGIVGLGERQPATRQRRMSSTGASTRKRAINNSGSRFDGSVEIPEPSPLFSRQSSMSTPKDSSRISSLAVGSAVEDERMKKLLDSQTKVARQLKNRKRPARCGNKSASSQNDNPASFDSTFDVDMASVASRKSRFEKEANAEEMARKRTVLTDLETHEESLEKSKKKKKNTFRLRDRIIEKENSKAKERTKMNQKGVEDGGLCLGTGLEWSSRS